MRLASVVVTTFTSLCYLPQPSSSLLTIPTSLITKTTPQVINHGARNAPFPPLSSSALDADLAPRLDGLDKPTVWHEFTPLANEYQSINLGQGFPNWDPPEFCVAHMNESVDPRYGRDANQYARPNAHLPLATVLAREYTAKLSRAIDPATEVASTVGCTNALFCALMGLIGGGDEVILMEPAFDLYVAQVKLAGGTVVAVPLRPSPTLATDDDPNANDSFQLDFEELEGKISPRSKVLILNTPHNPTGKMFSRSEMEALAGIVERHPQLTVITDEVYEHIVFDDVNSPHIHFASLPGMYERTLTLSSSGKTFSATGWKVGWAIGPPHLIRAVTSIQQWCNFSSPTPNQDAIALSLETASRDPYQSHPTYYSFLRSTYLHKRNLLLDVLRGANMTPIVPDGAFFVVAETSRVDFPWDRTERTESLPAGCAEMPRDWALCRWLTKEVGVTAIPPSAFYGVERVGLAKNLLRFAFCKSDESILEAGRRFERYFG